MKVKVASQRGCRGMSLAELLVVMGILSIVMLAITSLFVPAQRSTIVQTQVTDVQANLRLAMNTLSEDILNAGFLVADQPIVVASGTDFTIRTRLVGNGFGRILSASGAGNISVVLSRPEMAGVWNTVTKDWQPTNFIANGTWVRLFNPVNSRECDDYDETNAVAAAARVYRVSSVTFNKNGTNNDPSDDVATLTINTAAAGKAALSGGIGNAVGVETVIVKVSGENTPPLQTIRYRFADSDGDGTLDALQRIVNGQGQFLARNLSALAFAYDYTPNGKVQRVDIQLTGQTRAIVPGDSLSGAKSRALQSSVMLRNVF